MLLNICCPLLIIFLGTGLAWAVAISAFSAETYTRLNQCCSGSSTGGLTFPVPDTVFGLTNSVDSLFRINMSSVQVGSNVTFFPLTHVDSVNTQIIFPAPNKPDVTDFDFVIYQSSTQTLSNKTINGGDLRDCILSGSAATLTEGANITPSTAVLDPSSSQSGGIISAEIVSPAVPNYWEIIVTFTSPFSSVSTVQLTPSSTDSALMGPYCAYNITTSGFTIRQYINIPPPVATLISLFSYRVN